MRSVPEESLKGERTGCEQAIDSGRDGGPTQRGPESRPLSVALFATAELEPKLPRGWRRQCGEGRLERRRNTGVATNPRAKRLGYGKRLKRWLKRCESKRRGWVVSGEARGSSLSLRGRGFALHNERRFSPAPPRHRAREVPTCPNKAVGAAARRLGRLSRFPTALKPPPPRRGACAIIVPIKRLNCRCPSARRRWRWAVRLRNGFSVGTGATRAAMPPKTERGVSPVQRDWPRKLPRSVFRAVPCGHFASLVRSTFGLRDFPPNRRVAAHLRRIPAGVAPLSNEVGTTPRTTHRNTGGSCASRGLRLFSRQLGLYEDAAGTICAGRENRSPVHLGRVGTLQARGWTTGAARSVFGSAKQSRRIAVGESRRSIGGRIVRE